LDIKRRGSITIYTFHPDSNIDCLAGICLTGILRISDPILTSG